ncbi:uncharacterized protein E0L32_000191 [Thyridium curvatum]|uniref:GEgh 16 protein n=1 Tax=Thyridium curvatum TaxID=1093900 RepID=A0A507B7T0_9PEZI|nr:uncharacterized protein E0L32_000191 [Thyridium curvatum]TPX15857.1 hypothetical protein E0L32_000191 [Thyridium curvatum]
MSLSSLLSVAALVAVANAHGAIINAQGLAGSPPSVGFAVDKSIARNCTTISPCQLDATIIRDAEIKANIVNECGRTELAGNIDVGESTEAALRLGQVTQVKAGSKITVTIHQVNADGAGPYACDLDEESNAGIISQNLTVTNNVPGVNGFSEAKAQDFNITVTMPDKFTCTGASTGNVCTVRCRNNAVAGPFGGCFAVQQTDTKPKSNTPQNIATLQSLDDVMAQIEQNKKDLPAAVKANQNAGSKEGLQNAAAVSALLGQSAAPSVTQSASPVATSAAAGNGKGNGRNRGKANGRNRGKGNGKNNGQTNNAGQQGNTQNNGQQGNGRANNGGNRNGNNRQQQQQQQPQRRASFFRSAKRYVVDYDNGSDA